MKLVVVTPESEKLTADVSSVTIPGGLGEVGILPGHIPLLSTLEIGIIRYETPEGYQQLAVNRGFFEVNLDTIRILTETCETPMEIDLDRAEAALKRAEERLAKAALNQDVDVERASAAMRRASSRLNVAKK